jgi:anti-sigma B factor antagonist
MADDDRAPGLDITVRPHPRGYAEVVAAGDIDFTTHPVLSDALAATIAHGRPRILLDLSRVAFCDSTGLGVLVRASREATAREGWLRLAAPAPGVRRTLEITNLVRLIPTYETVAEAAREP